MPEPNVLIYLHRRDLRIRDNPILHHLATDPSHGFTHILPVYIFPSHQMETSGFIPVGGGPSPYPEAKSKLGRYRRCGPHRAKFVAEAVWDLKRSYKTLGIDLLLRVGLFKDAVKDLLRGLRVKAGAVWMTSEEGVEEKLDEEEVAALCADFGVDFQLWDDEKYLIHDNDLGSLKDLKNLPDVYADYRKISERIKPRDSLPPPAKLPSSLVESLLPPQGAPFVVPTKFEELLDALVRPIKDCIKGFESIPEGATNVHLFAGGESKAHDRLKSFILENGFAQYKTTEREQIGEEKNTLLSPYLAQGIITARQIYSFIVQYEGGTCDSLASTEGYGKGENKATQELRRHLHWRDYMRLSAKKWGHHLFRLEGFVGARSEGSAEEAETKWLMPDASRALADQDPHPQKVASILERFQFGTTGMSLIDASQRELLRTGYTSNRARQNVACFLAKRLHIDWRLGAEWYEMLSVDYDVASNWANWQYVAGVGNDPRGKQRLFNPVKQSYDYDKDGSYIRSWMPELRALQGLENLFQPWTTPEELLQEVGLDGHLLVTDPAVKIIFNINTKPRTNRRPYVRRHKSGARQIRTMGLVESSHG